METVQTGIRNALLTAGKPYLQRGTNNPYNGDTQTQYFADASRAFARKNLRWSSNMVLAQVQGLDYNDFYAYKPLRIRTAMMIDPTTGKNLGSDWQKIMVENPKIDFLPLGAKVVFNGNTWLVVNPMNVQSITGTSVIRRCNATWNHLDYYGNILHEPFCYGQGAGDLATGNSVKEGMILIDAYQHSVMQLNPDTEEIMHNRRMILGHQAYTVRGVQDFAQEFTEDIDSAHIQYFDLESAEPLAIDDMENRVADGLTFQWKIALPEKVQMKAGQEETLTPISYRSGEAVTDLPTGEKGDSITESAASVETDTMESFYTTQGDGTELSLPESMDLYSSFDREAFVPAILTLKSGTLYAVQIPVAYLWSSSDESVLTVDAYGHVKAVAEGTATITCALAKNPSITAEITCTVVANGAVIPASLEWLTPLPEQMAKYDECTVEAAYYEDGAKTANTVTYTFTGPDDSAYSAAQSGNIVQVKCWLPSTQPLVMTAECKNIIKTVEIKLTGW